METLATRLPVYIALTKLDLLQGFEPFFRSYTKNQREEVLGFTFSMDSVDDLSSCIPSYISQDKSHHLTFSTFHQPLT